VPKNTLRIKLLTTLFLRLYHSIFSEFCVIARLLVYLNIDIPVVTET